MRAAKRLLGSIITAPGTTTLFWPLLRGRATILMLHRFRMPDLGIEAGHDAGALRRILARLRAERYALVELRELLHALARGEAFPRPAVAFTIDDGYIDQAAVGAPAFAEFDCPVTTFATSGFLDRTLWFWWDRIEHIVEHAARPSVTLALEGAPLAYDLSSPEARRRAQADFTARCKAVPEREKLAAIDRLAAAAEVAVPDRAPDRYAPMSWDDLRRCERGGMTFGPHTVTHPVLSRADDAQSRHELVEGWARLRAEAARPTPVFCYPNGRPQDFGDREVRTLAEIGIEGAVTGVNGYADAAVLARDPDARFRVPRFGYTEELRLVLQATSGMERLREVARGRR